VTRRPLEALHAFTLYLAQAYGCRWLAPIGTSSRPDVEARLVEAASDGSGAAALAWSRSARQHATPTAEELRNALVVGTLPASGSARASAILDRVRSALACAPAGLVLFEGRGETRRDDVSAVRAMLAERFIVPTFVGHVSRPAGVLAVLERQPREHADVPPPDEFRVVAIVPAFNEEDIIAQTLRDLARQGIQAYLLDNWSDDATVERARPFLGAGLLAIERYPPRGPSGTYDLGRMLARVEEIARELDGVSWIVLHDVDERRRAPWPGVGLREALWRVDRDGFNCVDHVTLNFWPTDDGFHPDRVDLEEHFTHFDFSAHEGHFHQRRAWKNGGPVALAASAGHDVSFPGRRVYPYKFLLKHYPVRSQAHGERKLRERRARWNLEERGRGWHLQYDELPDRPAFVRSRATLTRFDVRSFADEFLIERLSGAGVFSVPPWWATPPRW